MKSRISPASSPGPSWLRAREIGRLGGSFPATCGVRRYPCSVGRAASHRAWSDAGMFTSFPTPRQRRSRRSVFQRCRPQPTTMPTPSATSPPARRSSSGCRHDDAEQRERRIERARRRVAIAGAAAARPRRRTTSTSRCAGSASRRTGSRCRHRPRSRTTTARRRTRQACRRSRIRRRRVGSGTSMHAPPYATRRSAPGQGTARRAVEAASAGTARTRAMASAVITASVLRHCGNTPRPLPEQHANTPMRHDEVGRAVVHVHQLDEPTCGGRNQSWIDSSWKSR